MKCSLVKQTLSCFLLCTALIALTGCRPPHAEQDMVVTSPDGHIQVEFLLEQGVPFYTVGYKQQPVLLPFALESAR